jgi:hypothetical protein
MSAAQKKAVRRAALHFQREFGWPPVSAIREAIMKLRQGVIR